MCCGEPPEWMRMEEALAEEGETCYECGRVIQDDDWVVCGVWEGKFLHFRTCVDCEELRGHVIDHYSDPAEDCAPCYGNLLVEARDWFEETWCPLAKKMPLGRMLVRMGVGRGPLALRGLRARLETAS